MKKNNDLKEAMRQFKMFAHNVKVQVSSFKSKLIKEEKKLTLSHKGGSDGGCEIGFSRAGIIKSVTTNPEDESAVFS